MKYPIYPTNPSIKAFASAPCVKTIKKNPLRVFSKNTLWSRELTLATHLHRKKKLFTSRFRSFFGFLKIKPFIKSCKFEFLSTFVINPRPYALSRIITQTKGYTVKAIQNELFNQYLSDITFISKNSLYRVLKVQRPTLLRGANFLFLKHRIYKYTTPKKKNYNPVYRSVGSLWQVDCRTGLRSVNYCTHTSANSGTISTYNWKFIT